MIKIFRFNTSELPRRAGEMKEYQLDIPIEEPIGIDVIAVPAGVLHLKLRLESVAEGVLATGEFDAVAKGECMRCLDPVELKLSREFQELYTWFRCHRDNIYKLLPITISPHQFDLKTYQHFVVLRLYLCI